MGNRAVTLMHGEPEYAALLGQIRADPALVDRMWRDAESRPDELDVPGTYWSVVTVYTGGRWVPAAWCAGRVQDDGVLKCFANFDAPAWRHRALYPVAYRRRHLDVVTRLGLPAVTYLFREPIRLHERDGWRRTGVRDVSTAAHVPHRWWELRRLASAPDAARKLPAVSPSPVE